MKKLNQLEESKFLKLFFACGDLSEKFFEPLKFKGFLFGFSIAFQSKRVFSGAAKRAGGTGLKLFAVFIKRAQKQRLLADLLLFFGKGVPVFFGAAVEEFFKFCSGFLFILF